MKNFNKIELLDKVNNIEVKKTINKLLDGLISMEKRKNIYVSDFLTPLEFNFAYKIISKLDIHYDIIFKNEDYDRKLIVFYKQDYDLKNFLEIIKFKDLDNMEHRNILGNILHLGINREKIGDIIKIENYWYVYCLKPIGKFIFSNGIKHLKQDVEVQLLDDIFIFENFREFSNEKIIVSSFRLDCFVKELSKTSREVSKKLIKNSYVKLNYNECNDFDKKVNSDDIISIRKVGKFKVGVVERTTKKDKYIVNVKRYK